MSSLTPGKFDLGSRTEDSAVTWVTGFWEFGQRRGNGEKWLRRSSVQTYRKRTEIRG